MDLKLIGGVLLFTTVIAIVVYQKNKKAKINKSKDLKLNQNETAQRLPDPKGTPTIRP